jgi:hypothetical protein
MDSQMAELPEDQAEGRDIAQRTDRLRQAINFAGGATAVSRKAAMAATTINNYLAGRDMKSSALVTLAKVCGVRIEWLATGHGAMQLSASAPDQVSVNSFPAEQLEAPAHFKALVMLLISCKEFYEKTGVVPTLADAFDWIGPLYGKFRSMPDGEIRLKSQGEG